MTARVTCAGRRARQTRRRGAGAAEGLLAQALVAPLDGAEHAQLERVRVAIAGGLAEAARERGALTVLPFALNYSAAHQLFAGHFDIAEQLIHEADSITDATRNVAVADFSVLLAAWRGDRDRTLELRERALPKRPTGARDC
ncbi:hypothetical protein AB0I81_54010 [Nonomuraea sp. NPDC050404]|uniref:hypothetical protein n=1 Tax=Nonomuraea sp. NPDC050404 TaxID=3155783 RepID=UPI003401447E